MDLVTAVNLCKCPIPNGCCDRWTLDCDQLSNAPASICSSAVQIDHLRQIYQQQLVTLDQLRAVGLLLGMSRSLLFKRR